MLIVFLVNIILPVYAQRYSILTSWQREANLSLAANIRMGCKTRLVSDLSMPPSYSDTLYVSVSYPTKLEMGMFQKLLPTLTKSNSDITANAIHKGTV